MATPDQGKKFWSPKRHKTSNRKNQGPGQECSNIIMWKRQRYFGQKVLKPSGLSEYKIVQKKKKENLKEFSEWMNYALDPCCPIWSIPSLCLPLLPTLSTSLQPPTRSPSLYASPPLPPHIPLSISLAPCPVTRCPHCEGDWVISVMSSKGKYDKAAGGNWWWWKTDVTGPLRLSTGPAVTLPSSPFCTRNSSSLCQAVSGVTAHERQYTPIPDKQPISVRCHWRHPAVSAGAQPSPAHPASHSIQQNPQTEDTQSEMKSVHRCRADSSASSSVSREGGVSTR